jgi:hypothetical protein
MIFSEMIQALVEGKQIVRDSWEVKDGYLVFLPGMPTVWKILTQPNPNAGNHLFTVEEFLADNWKIADHEVKEVAVELDAA